MSKVAEETAFDIASKAKKDLKTREETQQQLEGCGFGPSSVRKTLMLVFGRKNRVYKRKKNDSTQVEEKSVVSSSKSSNSEWKKGYKEGFFDGLNARKEMV